MMMLFSLNWSNKKRNVWLNSITRKAGVRALHRRNEPAEKVALRVGATEIGIVIGTEIVVSVTAIVTETAAASITANETETAAAAIEVETGIDVIVTEAGAATLGIVVTASAGEAVAAAVVAEVDAMTSGPEVHCCFSLPNMTMFDFVFCF